MISNRNLLFQGSIFRGYVSFRDGTFFLEVDLSAVERLAYSNPSVSTMLGWRRSYKKNRGSIPKMMVWKLYLLSNTAIFGIHVKFHGGISRWMEMVCLKKVVDGVIPYPIRSILRTGIFTYHKHQPNVPQTSTKCIYGIVFQKCEQLLSRAKQQNIASPMTEMHVW